MKILSFTDTETTHLDPRIGDAWEIGVIARQGDGPDREHLWQVRVSLAEADPKALDVGGYHQRFAVPGGAFAARMPTNGVGAPVPLDEQRLVIEIAGVLDGSVIVGSNPGFDVGFLAKLFRSAGVTPRWHYRPVDIVPLAVGFLYGRAEAATRRDCNAKHYDTVAQHVGFPWKSYEVSEAIGVARPAADVAHTALGDARWARDVYDMVTVPDAFYAADDDQLARMAGEALRDLHGGAR